MNVITVTKLIILNYKWHNYPNTACNPKYLVKVIIVIISDEVQTFPCHLPTSNENIVIILTYLYSCNTIESHCTVSPLKLSKTLMSI